MRPKFQKARPAHGRSRACKDGAFGLFVSVGAVALCQASFCSTALAQQAVARRRGRPSEEGPEGQPPRVNGGQVETLKRLRAFARDASPKISQADREAALQRIDELAAKVGHVSVDAPTGAVVTVDGIEEGDTPLPGPLDMPPGTHAVVVRMGTASRASRVQPRAGETIAVNVSFDGPGDHGSPPEVTAGISPAPVSPAAAPLELEPEHASHRTRTAVVASLTGGALLGTALGSGFVVAARGATYTARSATLGPSGDACAQSGSLRCTHVNPASGASGRDTSAAVVSLAGAAALAATGLAVWHFWRKPSDAKSMWFAPTVAHKGATVGVQGRF